MSIEQTQLQIHLNGQIQTGTMVSIDFNSLPGANPKELGYFVAIWQGPQIQDLSHSQHCQPLTTTDQAGSAVFDGLEIANSDYTIGFGVNNKNSTSTCATLYLPKKAKQFEPLKDSLSSITLVQQSTNSLIASFVTPAYNLPKTNNNWIALFKGPFTANMYKGINVVKTVMINEDSNEGAMSMNDIPGGLIRYKRYTLVYGMGLDSSSGKKDGEIDYSNLVASTEFVVA